MTASRLRGRPFRLLFAGQTVSLVGDNLIAVALAFAVLDLTGSPSVLGLALFARFAPAVALLPVGGVLADRLKRSRIMVRASLASATSQTLLGSLLVAGVARIWHVVVLQAVAGTASAFFRPASNSILPQLVERPQLQQANALFSLTGSVGAIVGPAVAGVVVALTSPGWAIVADGATFAVAAACFAGLRPAREAEPRERGSFLGDLGEGWKHVRARRWVWSGIASAGLFQLAVLSSMTVLGPVVSDRSLGGAPAWGAILAGGGVGAVLGGAASLRFRPRRPLRAGYVLSLLAGPTLVLLAFSAPVEAIVAAEVAGGFGAAFYDTLWTSTLQERIPDALLSRVMAYDWLGSLGPRPIGLALAGPVAELVGLRATLLGCACLAAVSAAGPLAFRDVRDLTRG